MAVVGDVIAKNCFSESSGGRGILITATGTAGTTIHYACAGSTNFDEIWLWAMNSHTASIAVTIEFGGVSDPKNLIKKTVPADDGLYCIIPGLPLNNSGTIAGFVGTATSEKSQVAIYGHVHELTAT